MDKGQIAVDNFKSGLNCAQAVVLAFKDELKIDELTLKKASIVFGGGLGRQRLTCGAVSGMFMVAGLVCGYDNPEASTEKTVHYTLIQKLAEEFKKLNGTIICRQLLGLETNGNTDNAYAMSEATCRDNRKTRGQPQR